MNKKILLACLVATVLYAIYQFWPQINDVIMFGVILILRSTMWAYMIIPWMVAGALVAAIALVYYLADIRNNIFAAALGFSVSFMAVSLLMAVLQTVPFVEFVIGAILAYGLFVGATLLASKFRLKKVFAIIVAGVLMSLSLYFTPLLTHPIVAERISVKSNNTFIQAAQNLKFIPYYPTYSSTHYPASAPKLNGYEATISHSNTVTFLLGKAQVKQSAYLEGQDKIMDFTYNCSIFRIWSAMDSDTSISQRTIEQSLDSPQKCNLLQVTPSGKKVYFNDDGQWVRFYVLLGKTNFIIDFDNVNNRKYDPGTQSEILKIIDSLQPLDKAKLEKGNRYRAEFY